MKRLFLATLASLMTLTAAQADECDGLAASTCYYLHKAERSLQPQPSHDYRTDFICRIPDISGHTNMYAFHTNTRNQDGSAGGTFVETGYERDGHLIAAPAGNRPIWIWSGSTLIQRVDPSWMIQTSPSGKAALLHKGVVVGSGNCDYNHAPTASTVGDQGEP
jgi:hypothetical protein